MLIVLFVTIAGANAILIKNPLGISCLELSRLISRARGVRGRNKKKRRKNKECDNTRSVLFNRAIYHCLICKDLCLRPRCFLLS